MSDLRPRDRIVLAVFALAVGLAGYHTTGGWVQTYFQYLAALALLVTVLLVVWYVALRHVWVAYKRLLA